MYDPNHHNKIQIEAIVQTTKIFNYDLVETKKKRCIIFIS